jgi:hypothetical protein
MIDATRFYSVPALIRETAAPRGLVYEALQRGELRALRRGRSWLVPGGAALDWIDSLSHGNGDAKP